VLQINIWSGDMNCRVVSVVALPVLIFASFVSSVYGGQIEDIELVKSEKEVAEANKEINDREEYSTDARRGIEEVVVTARRREESLSDVPVSITVITGEAMQNAGIDSTNDLEIAIPSLVVNEAIGYSMPSIRGIGTNGFSPAVDASVATIFDGFYSPSTVGAFQYLGDVESVQVLKGPQGTLFGRNTTAGVILITSKKPSEEFEVKASYTTGSRDKESLNLFLSGPVSDVFGYSISVFTNEQGHHYKRTGPYEGEPLKPSDESGMRISLNSSPYDWLELDASYSIFETYRHGSAMGQLDEVGILNVSVLGDGAKKTPPRESESDLPGFSQAETETYTFKATVSSDSMEAWLQYGVSDVLHGQLTDLDSSAGARMYTAYDFGDYYSDIDSLEFQINSLSADWSIFGVEWEWLGGVYYSEALAGWDPITNAADSALVGSLVGIDTSELLDLDVLIDVTGIVETQSLAAFTNHSFIFTDWFTVDLGARYSKEIRTLVKHRSTIGLSNTDILSTVLQGTPVGGLLDSLQLDVAGFGLGLTSDGSVLLRDVRNQDLEYDDVSFLFGTNFFIGDSLIYFKSVQGFKSGTWNMTSLTEEPNGIDPETVESYEIGFKTKFFHDTVSLNGSTYYYDYRNLQDYTVSIASAGTVLVRNIPESEVSGAELDLFWVIPIPGLMLSINSAYIDSEVVSWEDAPCHNDQTFLSEDCNAAGNRLGSSPEWTVSTDLSYAFFYGSNEFVVGVNHYYNGGFFFDAAENELEQEPYDLIGARAVWRQTEWGTTVQLTGKNLGSTDYRNYGIIFEAGEQVLYSPSKEWFLSLTWEF
jgi:iron complex outermembrane receptor protein